MRREESGLRGEMARLCVCVCVCACSRPIGGRGCGCVRCVVTRLHLAAADCSKDMEFVRRVGGAPGLAKLLHSDLAAGLSADPAARGLDSVEEHRKVFGANRLPETPPKNVSCVRANSPTE